MKRPYISVTGSALTFPLPFRLLGTFGDGEGEGSKDGERGGVGDGERRTITGCAADRRDRLSGRDGYCEGTGGGLDFTSIIVAGCGTRAGGGGGGCWLPKGWEYADGLLESKPNEMRGSSVNQSWTDTSGTKGGTICPSRVVRIHQCT